MSDYQSIREIIQEEAKNGFPAQKRTYKLQLAKDEDDDEFSTSRKGKAKYNEYPEKQIQNLFLTLKVKQCSYFGKPAISINVNHVTKKVMQKLQNLQRQEERQEQVQAESHKSTISHELRTPLGSTSFIVKKIIELIT